MTTITTELAQLIENAYEAENQLRHLADNEIDSDSFAVTTENYNGIETEFERPIIDLALDAANTITALLDALAAKDAQLEEYRQIHRKHAARLIDERGMLRQRIAELEARPEQQPVSVPDGWKLVPVEPTKDMLRAGQSVVGFWLNTLHCYSQMLAAAPASQPAHTFKDEIAEQAGIDPAIADAYMQGCRDTESRMAEQQPAGCDSCGGNGSVSIDHGEMGIEHIVCHKCQAVPASQPVTDDTRRMDWLVSKTVNVREPMVYGSHDLFWSQTTSDDWEEAHATSLREQIDAAMQSEAGITIAEGE